MPMRRRARHALLAALSAPFRAAAAVLCTLLVVLCRFQLPTALRGACKRVIRLLARTSELARVCATAAAASRVSVRQRPQPRLQPTSQNHIQPQSHEENITNNSETEPLLPSIPNHLLPRVIGFATFSAASSSSTTTPVIDNVPSSIIPQRGLLAKLQAKRLASSMPSLDITNDSSASSSGSAAVATITTSATATATNAQRPSHGHITVTKIHMLPLTDSHSTGTNSKTYQHKTNIGNGLSKSLPSLLPDNSSNDITSKRDAQGNTLRKSTVAFHDKTNGIISKSNAEVSNTPIANDNSKIQTPIQDSSNHAVELINKFAHEHPRTLLRAVSIKRLGVIDDNYCNTLTQKPLKEDTLSLPPLIDGNNKIPLIKKPMTTSKTARKRKVYAMIESDFVYEAERQSLVEDEDIIDGDEHDSNSDSSEATASDEGTSLLNTANDVDSKKSKDKQNDSENDYDDNSSEYTGEFSALSSLFGEGSIVETFDTEKDRMDNEVKEIIRELVDGEITDTDDVERAGNDTTDGERDEYLIVDETTVFAVDRCIRQSRQLNVPELIALLGQGKVDEVVYRIMRIKEGFSRQTREKAVDVGVLAHSLTLMTAVEILRRDMEARAQVAFSHDSEEHTKMLSTLWKQLFPDDPHPGKISLEWQKLGFQGKDPATDFRGMGVLALEMMVYFAKTYPEECVRCMQRAHEDRDSWFSWALAGVHVCSLVLQLLREGKLSLYLYTFGPFSDTVLDLFCLVLSGFEAQWYASRGKVTVLDFERELARFRADVAQRLVVGEWLSFPT